MRGPFTTDAVLTMISTGEIQGHEQISKIPDGTWGEVSSIPIFYDQIMSILEGHAGQDPQLKKKQTEETVIAHPPSENELLAKRIHLGKERQQPNPEVLSGSISPMQQRNQNTSADGSGLVIELKQLPELDKENVLKRFLLPSVIATVAVIFITVFLFTGESIDYGGTEKVPLIGPNLIKADLSEPEIKTRINEALFNIESDTFRGYLTAQSLLVQVVENSRDLPRNSQLEARALLCMVYKFLWPYSTQSVQDIQIVKSLRDSTRALDVISPYGDVCDIVRVSTQSSFRELRSTVDSVFAKNLAGFNMLPVLYQFKGELLELDKDYINAVGFLDSAMKLWPKWIRPTVDLASSLMKTGKAEDAGKAAQFLRQVIQASPNHKTSRYLMGILEAREFKNSEAAFSQLSIAVELDDRAPAMLEAQAFEVYAELLSGRSERDGALKYAQKALSLNPNNNQLKQLVLRLGGDERSLVKSSHLQMIFMGEMYEKQGDCLAAQAEYKAAFEVDPRNGLAALKAGKCLWQLNQSFEATEWLKKAIKAEPKLVSAYVTLSDYLSQRFDFMGATQTLISANRENPNNYELLRGFAVLEYRKGNLKGAIDYAKRSASLYDGDIETFIILSRASAEFAAASVAFSAEDSEKRKNLAEDAFRFATKAIEMNPTHVEAQVNYANVMSTVQGSSVGVTHLEEKVRAFGYEVEYRVALGELLMKEEKFIDSQRVFENIVAIDRRNKRAWLGLGLSHRARGNNNEALRSFLEAAVIDPTDAQGLFEAGRIYYETQRFEEAIDQFRRVSSINSNYPRAQFYIGKTALAAGNLDAAIEAAKKEQQMNPQIADSYILMGEVYSAKRQYTDCASAYSQAIKYRPQGAEIYVRSAQCYRQSGSLDIAEDMLSLAMSRESGFADIYREQGAIFETKGDFRAAFEAYRKYLGLAPNAPDRILIEGKLRAFGGS